VKRAKEVSISAAREHLPSLVRDAERGLTVTLTRRGEPVAVLISTERYRAHAKSAIPFSRALEEFRSAYDLKELDIESVYEGLRDRSPGRLVQL
jgi:prevent-host-death family protein